MQIDQIPINKFYIYIHCLVSISRIIITIERRKFDVIVLQRSEEQCQG